MSKARGQVTLGQVEQVSRLKDLDKISEIEKNYLYKGKIHREKAS